MRLGYSGLKFSGSFTEMKEFLEKKVEEEELAKLMEEKDKEDYEFMVSHQGDNMRFSG